jgi:hypothetical protein
VGGEAVLGPEERVAGGVPAYPQRDQQRRARGDAEDLGIALVGGNRADRLVDGGQLHREQVVERRILDVVAAER